MTKQLKPYRCANCGSTNVQILLPAWVAANDAHVSALGLQPPDVDTEAEPLDYHCEICGHDRVLDPNDREVAGRWA